MADVTDKDREAGRAAMRAADHAHGLDAKAECYAEAIATARAEVRAELDAERDAHAETKAEVGRLMAALYGDGSSVPGAEDEITALKARLALAEAVCESCCSLWDVDVYDHDALAVWRAGK